MSPTHGSWDVTFHLSAMSRQVTTVAPSLRDMMADPTNNTFTKISTATQQYKICLVSVCLQNFRSNDHHLLRAAI